MGVCGVWRDVVIRLVAMATMTTTFGSRTMAIRRDIDF
jgi:hypothetical protein